MNILMVDDDTFFRKFYSAKLTAQGFHVETVGGGQEALTYLSKARPDVVLLDLIMPQVDGFEVLTQIQRMPQLEGMPIIVFSTLSQPQDMERARSMGASDFVNKSSLNFTTLVSTIQTLTQRKTL